MKSTAVVCAIVAASMGLSTLAFAQDNDGHRRGDDERYERHGERHDGRRAEPRYDQRFERYNDRRDYYNARGPEFYRGGYIPSEFRRHEYVVDYHEHHLAPPPRGHQWVQVGADYVLVAIATGVIANIILNH